MGEECVEEPAVIDGVCQYLQTTPAKFWIDRHYTLQHLPFPQYRIFIGGHCPDIFGVDRFHRIFAIEAKGTEDIEKAIGQALTYKRGVMLSYIAAEESALESQKDIIQSVGLGLMLVDENDPSHPKIVEPMYSFYPQYLEDVKSQIEILLAEKRPDIRLMTLGKTQILNYIAPIFFAEETGSDINIIRISISQEWGVDLTKDSAILAGCEYLELINRSGNVIYLTPRGREFRYLLLRMGYNNPDLAQWKQHLNKARQKVAEQDSNLAYVIRTLYEKKLEYRQFVKILHHFDQEEVSFQQVLDEVVNNYPSLFLNALCKQDDAIIDQVKFEYQRGNIDNIKSKQFLQGCLNKNVYYGFKIQLMHLGVLKFRHFPDGRIGGGFDGKYEDYDPAMDIWVINQDIGD